MGGLTTVIASMQTDVDKQLALKFTAELGLH